MLSIFPTMLPRVEVLQHEEEKKRRKLTGKGASMKTLSVVLLWIQRGSAFEGAPPKKNGKCLWK